MVKWAEQTGPHTARLFERILAEKPHPEMGYRSCLGIIRLAEQYSAARMEAAADRALRTGACRYQSVKSILKNSLDQQPLAQPPTLPPPPPVTTSEAPGTSGGGLSDAPTTDERKTARPQTSRNDRSFERQEQDEAARELSFLDRLALLIDQQWNWQQNQALTRRVKASRLRGGASVEDINYRAERR